MVETRTKRQKIDTGLTNLNYNPQVLAEEPRVGGK